MRHNSLIQPPVDAYQDPQMGAQIEADGQVLANETSSFLARLAIDMQQSPDRHGPSMSITKIQGTEDQD